MAKISQFKSSPENYDLVINPTGYYSKKEITNQVETALVKGSKNVIINDGDKVASRKGYTLDGQARTVTKGVDSSWDFISKTGKKVLRANQGATAGNGKLQVRTEYTPGTIVYADLLSSLTYTGFNFSTWWYNAEATRVLMFVDGTNSLRMWGGGIAYVASNTATTITLSGTQTWAQLGFFVAHASRAITINGVSYTYTGGEGTTTLTGLSGLPALTAGTPVFQTVVTTTSLTDIPSGTTYDLIWTKDNHLVLGDTQSSVVYGSKVDDYTDYGFTLPLRSADEGFKITLDNFAVGFVEDTDSFYTFAGLDDLYKINFVVTQDGSSETITVQKVRAGAGQAAISQSAIIPVKNGIMYFTNEKTLSWLTSVQNVFTPQSLPISDSIKDDFDSFDLTNVSGVFFENEIWIAIPQENLVYRYDFDKALWQSPQTLPVSRFSIIKNETTNKNELYGHSNTSNETYKLNDGWTDNGIDIDYVAAFAYRSFGKRAVLKQFDEYFTELYMTTSTSILCTHRFEYLGAELVVDKTILGSDTGLIFAPNPDSSLGKNNLGKNPLGSLADEISDLSKYRHIAEMKLVDFFEHQVIYSSIGRFEIICHGPNVRYSTNIPTSIKR